MSTLQLAVGGDLLSSALPFCSKAARASAQHRLLCGERDVGDSWAT